MSRQAISRNTEVASELESWMDDESDNLSTNLFDGLEEVAESIDDIVSILEEEISDADDKIEILETEIKRLEYQIEELEESE